MLPCRGLFFRERTFCFKLFTEAGGRLVPAGLGGGAPQRMCLWALFTSGAVDLAKRKQLQKASKTQEYERKRKFLELLGAILAHFGYFPFQN